MREFNREFKRIFEETNGYWVLMNLVGGSDQSRLRETIILKRHVCELKPSYKQITALRAECPGLDDVTTEMIIKHFTASSELAAKLMERLPIGRPPIML